MISVDATATGITIAIAGHAPGIIAKATIVLAVCGCIAASTTRASAARRHLLWLCALVSCGALALLAPISKRIVVPMPAFVAAHASSGRAGGRDRHDVSIAGDESSHSAPVDVTPGRQDPSQNWKPLALARWLPAALATIGFIVWLAGVLFVTLRFAFAYRSVNAVVRRLSERGGSRWQASLARLADRRDIRVRVGGDLRHRSRSDSLAPPSFFPPTLTTGATSAATLCCATRSRTSSAAILPRRRSVCSFARCSGFTRSPGSLSGNCGMSRSAPLTIE